MVARKTRSTPVRMVTYGLPLGPDADSRHIVAEQFYGARRYRNELIAIERKRAQVFRELRAQASPELAAVCAEVDTLTERRKQVRAEIKVLRAAKRTRKVAPELLTEVKQLEEAIKKASARRKEATQTANEVVKGPAAQALDDEAREAIKAVYNESPVFWGTKLLVHKSVEQAVAQKRKEAKNRTKRKKKRASDKPFDPDVEHRPWDRVICRRTGMSLGGSGRIGVQIQKPTTVEDLLEDRCNFARIELGRTISGGRRHAMLWLRIGSDGIKPVWAKFPMVYHRPLPPGARITWVFVTRTRESMHRFRWQVCLSVESETYAQKLRVPGAVASINFCWRQRLDETLRAGYIVGTDGHEQEIVLPHIVLDALEHARGLREVRQRNLNVLRPEIPTLQGMLPPEYQEHLEGLRESKSFNRFARAAYTLRDQLGADHPAVIPLIEWAKRDVHLGDWEAREVDKALRRRKEMYRLVMRDLCQRYSEFVFDNTDFSELSALHQVEEADKDLELVQRRQRFECAPSELRQSLVLAASNNGTRLTPGDVSTGPSKTCYVCGGANGWDGVRIWHRCESCGVKSDMDANFCRNLLASDSRPAGE